MVTCLCGSCERNSSMLLGVLSSNLKLIQILLSFMFVCDHLLDSSGQASNENCAKVLEFITRFGSQYRKFFWVLVAVSKATQVLSVAWAPNIGRIGLVFTAANKPEELIISFTGHRPGWFV